MLLLTEILVKILKLHVHILHGYWVGEVRECMVDGGASFSTVGAGNYRKAKEEN